MSMFPGPGARIYYNEAGEPLGWDYPSYDEGDSDPYDGADDRDYDEDEWCEEHQQTNCGEDHDEEDEVVRDAYEERTWD
jgi:hypothetical protein